MNSKARSFRLALGALLLWTSSGVAQVPPPDSPATNRSIDPGEHAQEARGILEAQLYPAVYRAYEDLFARMTPELPWPPSNLIFGTETSLLARFDTWIENNSGQPIVVVGRSEADPARLLADHVYRALWVEAADQVADLLVQFARGGRIPTPGLRFRGGDVDPELIKGEFKGQLAEMHRAGRPMIPDHDFLLALYMVAEGRNELPSGNYPGFYPGGVPGLPSHYPGQYPGSPSVDQSSNCPLGQCS